MAILYHLFNTDAPPQLGASSKHEFDSPSPGSVFVQRAAMAAPGLDAVTQR